MAPGWLTGLEFVSADQGWAVGQDTILATTDGGAHWAAQLSGKLNLTSADFISGRDGWVVGTTSLLATTDGGAHWTALPEPCPVIRSVHFISPSTGFAVAGGENASGAYPDMPVTGGVALTTSDGGHTWHTLATPANAQTVCFSDARHGWLGAAGLLYRTSDGGVRWTALTSMSGQQHGSGESTYVADMSVECANDGSAWALRIGPGAAMSQEAHVGFHADQAGATPLFAEQYFQTPGGKPAAESPGLGRGPVLRDRPLERGLHRLVLGVRLRHRALGHRHQLRRDPHQGGERRRDHPAAGGQLPVLPGRLGGRHRHRLPDRGHREVQVPGAHRGHHGRRPHLARSVRGPVDQLGASVSRERRSGLRRRRSSR